MLRRPSRAGRVARCWLPSFAAAWPRSPGRDPLRLPNWRDYLRERRDGSRDGRACCRPRGSPERVSDRLLHRVVIDPNVLISATITPRGALGPILHLIDDGTLVPVVTRHLVDEVIDVLGRPKLANLRSTTDETRRRRGWHRASAVVVVGVVVDRLATLGAERGHVVAVPKRRTPLDPTRLRLMHHPIPRSLRPMHPPRQRRQVPDPGLPGPAGCTANHQQERGRVCHQGWSCDQLYRQQVQQI